MKVMKKVFEQFILYLILLCSGSVTVYSFLQLRRIRSVTADKAFIDLSLKDLDGAYELLRSERVWTTAFRWGLIVFILFVLIIAAYYAVPHISGRIKKKRQSAPPESEPPSPR